MKRLFVIVLVLFLSFFLLYAAPADGWKLERNDERMKLWTRPVPGSDVREVRAVARITGTIKEALDILFDRCNHPKYFKYIEHSEVLKKTKDCDWSYNVVSPPLATDRDYLVESCVENKSDGSVVLWWKPFTDPRYPEGKDGNVRVKINKGYWRFWQIGPDELKIEYYIYTDPAGSLPNWIKKRANKSAVPQTIWSVYKEIMRRRGTTK